MRINPFVSIVILNYDGLQFLNICLASVFKTEYPEFEIILVDNASCDNSLENALKIFGRDNRLRIVRNKRNLGFGVANNVGYNHAKGEYVVFLNNDTVVDPMWLKELVEVMEKDNTIGIAQSLILNSDATTIQTAGWLISDYFYGLTAILENQRCTNTLPDVFEISYASGAAMIVRRETINEIGLFDPKYFWFYDDTYLSFKTWLVGERVVTVSKSRVCHAGGGTAGFDSPFIRRNNTICFISLVFDVYWSSIELIKALFIFNYCLIINSLKEVLERKKTTRFWASVYAGCWIMRNLKYIWKNRLRYFNMAKVSQEVLLSKFIRIRVPASVYLVPPPVKLLPKYLLNENRKYLETLMSK